MADGASISAPDLGIFSHAKYFIRKPGTNKIREYGSNLQLIKFERGCAGQLKYFLIIHTCHGCVFLRFHTFQRACGPKVEKAKFLIKFGSS